jgi:hypothetical protein
VEYATGSVGSFSDLAQIYRLAGFQRPGFQAVESCEAHRFCPARMEQKHLTELQ